MNLYLLVSLHIGMRRLWLSPNDGVHSWRLDVLLRCRVRAIACSGVGKGWSNAFEDLFIPACAEAFAADVISDRRVLLQNVEGHAAKRGRFFGGRPPELMPAVDAATSRSHSSRLQ